MWQQPKLDSIVNDDFPQHSELVIIVDDDSRQQTQPCDSVDSDDGTIESSLTHTHSGDSVDSENGSIESSSIHTPNGSHYCFLGNKSVGFDTFSHSFGSISSHSLSLLDNHYGINNIHWNKPVIINNKNIDDSCWKKYYTIIHSNIFLVIEGPPETGYG